MKMSGLQFSIFLHVDKLCLRGSFSFASLLLSLHSDNIQYSIFNYRHEVFLFPSKQQQRNLSETWLYCIILILHFYILINSFIHPWLLPSPPTHSSSTPLPTRGSPSKAPRFDFTPRGLDPSLPSASASSLMVHPKGRRTSQTIPHPSPSTLVRYQMSRL